MVFQVSEEAKQELESSSLREQKRLSSRPARGVESYRAPRMDWWSSSTQQVNRGLPGVSKVLPQSWGALWLRTASLGLLLLLLFFGGSEIIERTWFQQLQPSTLHRLHQARELGGALLLGTWAFLSIRQARRAYDASLQDNLDALEVAVTRRTAELAQAQAFVELLFDALPERLVVRDSDGKIVKANRVARQHEELDEERLWEVEHVPVLVGGQEQGLSLEIARDVTRPKNLEAQIRHQEKMAGLGLMAAGFAHDLGNPLASIASELELLEGEEDPKQMRASLAVLQRHIGRINRTLREMTEFARRRRDEVADVDVNLAIHDSLKLVRHDPRWKQVQVDLQLTPGAPPVRMVEDHLILVLINLMLNAADAMPTGGVFRIVTERQRGGVLIRAIDTGVGMTPEVLRHAMKPLFTTKAAHRGTGLGLSVSGDVVRALGGTLELFSEPSQGTEVQLWLPSPQYMEKL